MSCVKEFTENTTPVYPESSIKEMDEKCLFYYSKAVDEVSAWVKKVLLEELADNQYTGAYAKLYLPVSDVEIRVCCETVGAKSPSLNTPEVYHTPIGEIDYAVYNAIIDQKDNPVKMLYEYLSMQIKNLCVLYTHENDSMIREEFLEAEKVTDVLGLHRMEMLLYDIEGFLEGRYWMSASDLNAERNSSSGEPAV